MTGETWPGGGACLPAILMAVRHVNERPGLLDGYNVTYTWADTKVIINTPSNIILYLLTQIKFILCFGRLHVYESFF